MNNSKKILLYGFLFGLACAAPEIVNAYDRKKPKAEKPAQENKSEGKKITIISPIPGADLKKSTEAAKPELKKYQINAGIENDLYSIDFALKLAKDCRLVLSHGFKDYSSENPVFYSSTRFDNRGNTIESKNITSNAIAVEKCKYMGDNCYGHYGLGFSAKKTRTNKTTVEEILNKSGNVLDMHAYNYPEVVSNIDEFKARVGIERLLGKYFNVNAEMNLGLKESSLKINAGYMFGGKNKK